MKIINLTQHVATSEQVEEGVVDLPADYQANLRALLTFDSLPDRREVVARAEAIGEIAEAFAVDSGAIDSGGEIRAMIGGAPFLMRALEDALMDRGITPIYAFSRRESVEERQPDGSVRKINFFRHAGFVPAY